MNKEQTLSSQFGAKNGTQAESGCVNLILQAKMSPLNTDKSKGTSGCHWPAFWHCFLRHWHLCPCAHQGTSQTWQNRAE